MLSSATGHCTRTAASSTRICLPDTSSYSTPAANTPRSILIDLDSAVEAHDEEDPDFSMVGTRVFMAIDVLHEKRHTCHHDLESFLYLFLWTVIANHTDSSPEGSKLREWNAGSWNELAARKATDISENFEVILDEFAPQYDTSKPVAGRLHRILFGVEGTIADTDDSKEGENRLYDKIMSAFNKY